MPFKGGRLRRSAGVRLISFFSFLFIEWANIYGTTENEATVEDLTTPDSPQLPKKPPRIPRLNEPKRHHHDTAHHTRTQPRPQQSSPALQARRSTN
jgi:hypothetical protein